MSRLAIAITTLLLAGPAAAHGFWIQPRAFATTVDIAVPMTIWVGHGKDRQRWSAPIDRVTALTATGPAGSRDIRAALRPTGGSADAEPSFTAPGTYVIALETSRAISDLPAIRFNDYIKAEGIAPAIAARARAGTTGASGREFYSRRAKAIVRVGASTAPQPQVTRPVGMTLEIVPSRDPTATDDQTLPVTVLYQGRPLAGAFVKLNNLDFDARPVATAMTDARGGAVFKVPFKGLWQLNVVWTKPIKDPKADFDTVFSSLTFGWSRATAASH